MPEAAIKRNFGAIFLVLVVLVVLGVILYAFPPWDVASDGPSKLRQSQMAYLPIALMWVGSFILATALIYGILSTRSRTRNEKRRGEEVTRKRYQEEQT
jgi:peptidoglycan biosynthesis protein MviN/MurJ (putative lipid II flippase)